MIEDINAVLKIVEEASMKLSTLLKQPVELNIIKPDLKGFKTKTKALSYLKQERIKAVIIKEVGAQYGLSMAAMTNGSRKRPSPDARKLACYLLGEYVPNITDGQIGTMLSIDRTTVIYNRQECEILLKTNNEFGFNFRMVVKKIADFIKKPLTA